MFQPGIKNYNQVTKVEGVRNGLAQERAHPCESSVIKMIDKYLPTLRLLIFSMIIYTLCKRFKN